MFEKGRAWNEPPLRVVIANLNSEFPLQAGFSVSKKKFKKAVDRNRIKRLMREAWRLNTIPLKEKLTAAEKSLSVFIIYIGNELPDYRVIEEKIVKVNRRILDTVT